MTTSIQSTTTDLSTIAQQLKDFEDGKSKITKDSLKTLITSKITNGETPSAKLLDLFDSYDKIDKDGDGISNDEYKTYQNTPEGILSSLGLSQTSLFQQSNTTATAKTLLDYLSNDTDSSSNFTGFYSSSAYTDKLLEEYSTSNTTTNKSLIDYLS